MKEKNFPEDRNIFPKKKRTKGLRLMAGSVAAVLCICTVAGLGIHTMKQTSDLSGGKSEAKELGKYYTASEDYGEIYDYLSDHSDNSLSLKFEDGYDNGTVVQEIESAGTSSNGDYSVTNVVTEGVDESDIAKTDGDYIYTVRSASIGVSDIRKGKPKTIKAIELPMDDGTLQANEIYVSNHILTVIAGGYDDDGDYTYCYVYNVKNPAKAKLLGSTKQKGSYSTSRMIDDQVYLITDQYMEGPEMDRKEALNTKNLSKWLPTINDRTISNDCIYMAREGLNGTLISSFSTKHPDQTESIKFIIANTSGIYASKDALYLYEEAYSYNGSKTFTKITRLNLNQGKISAAGSTRVAGSITDSFALNEKDGYLRIVASRCGRDSNVNQLYVLDRSLKLVGRIDEIAPGEEIYAARYVGDLAYFITYENTDPLFVADLSKPDAPKLLGEVKVKGFSEYLHMWDKSHLLGIGYSDDENGTGVMLTMFDITDPTRPKVEKQYTLKGNCYSDAVTSNYKGLLIDQEKNLIGFPAMDYGMEGDSVTQTFYQLLRYDKKKGFSVCAKKYADNYSESDYRGLYSGNYFYIAGGDRIQYFKLK